MRKGREGVKKEDRRLEGGLDNEREKKVARAARKNLGFFLFVLLL